MKKPALWICLCFLIQSVPAFSRGDKCVPQVADGDNIRTKFDLVNVSPRQTISNFKLRFYRQDGTSWTIKTNLGQGSEFPLNLNARQTLRVETSGASSPTTSGYAIIEDNEPNNSVYAMDFVLGVSVYYEISTGSGVVDTVSVPVAQPTGLGTFPVEVRRAQNIYTGIAIVNLTSGPNQIKIDLYPSDTGTAGTATLALDANKQRAEFFHENLFPSLRSQDFKGMAEFKAQGPIAILALLQTQTANGVQYATLVPTDREALRRNSYVYVPEATYVAPATNTTMPVDIDNFTVDYLRVGDDEGFPWDIIYKGVDKKTRRLETINGSGFAVLGKLDDNGFDAVSLPQLMNLTYKVDPIDVSDGSSALTQVPFAFAVLTDIGNYAKVRLIGTKQFQDDKGNPYVDLIFEVTVYR